MSSLTTMRPILIVLALVVVGFAVTAVVLGGGGLAEAVGLRAAEVQVADGDEEWLALIEEARRARETVEPIFPDPRLGEGVVEVDSCSDIPATAERTNHVAELSTNQRVHRTIVFFSDPDAGTRYALFLRSDADHSDCSEPLRRLAYERPHVFAAIDDAVCAEMRRMAEGQAPTDETLRQASPAVASAYVETFCTAE